MSLNKVNGVKKKINNKIIKKINYTFLLFYEIIILLFLIF